MLLLPNVGILSEAGKLVAWGYIGIDGSFATLYVLEEYRGKGLATSVAVELMAEVLLLIYDLMVRRGGCILMLRRAMRGVRE